MSEGLAKLQTIGAQKIHEKTHIAKHHVQGILHGTFDAMTKIQFIGFISILEREYGVDLSDVRERGMEYYNTAIRSSIEEAQVFVAPKKKKSNKLLYTLLALAVFIGAIIYTNSNEEQIIENLIQDDRIETIKEVLVNGDSEQVDEVAKEEQTPLESDPKTKQVEKEKEKLSVANSLSIIPKTKVWLGYIDLQTKRKNQTTITTAFALEADKEYLLSLGHGHIEIEIDGKKSVFSEPNQIKFHYVDGTLKQITTAEFKELNGGTLW